MLSNGIRCCCAACCQCGYSGPWQNRPKTALRPPERPGRQRDGRHSRSDCKRTSRAPCDAWTERSVLNARSLYPKRFDGLTRNITTGTRRYALALASTLAILAAYPQPGSAQAYRIDTLLGDFDPLEEVPLSSAWTENPVAVAVDAAGNIYFAESAIGRVHKIDQSGRVSTVAGSGLTGDSGDGGPATRARFGRIEGLAVDLAGNPHIADSGNYRIRRVDTSGTIEKIAGTGEFGWDGDGGPMALT